MRRVTFPPRGRFVLGMAVILLSAPPALSVPAQADDHALTRATLKGVPAVQVLVEEIEPDAEKDGLTRDQVLTDVGMRLRKAGITVVPSAKEYLYVNVNTYKSGTDLYAFAISVEFKQGVRLIRDSKVVTFAPTWSVGSVGTVGPKNLQRIVRANVANHVDEFISAYLEQNPKP